MQALPAGALSADAVEAWQQGVRELVGAKAKRRIVVSSLCDVVRVLMLELDVAVAELHALPQHLDIRKVARVAKDIDAFIRLLASCSAFTVSDQRALEVVLADVRSSAGGFYPDMFGRVLQALVEPGSVVALDSFSIWHLQVLAVCLALLHRRRRQRVSRRVALVQRLFAVCTAAVDTYVDTCSPSTALFAVLLNGEAADGTASAPPSPTPPGAADTASPTTVAQHIAVELQRKVNNAARRFDAACGQHGPISMGLLSLCDVALKVLHGLLRRVSGSVLYRLQQAWDELVPEQVSKPHFWDELRHVSSQGAHAWVDWAVGGAPPTPLLRQGFDAVVEQVAGRPLPPDARAASAALSSAPAGDAVAPDAAAAATHSEWRLLETALEAAVEHTALDSWKLRTSRSDLTAKQGSVHLEAILPDVSLDTAAAQLALCSSDEEAQLYADAAAAWSSEGVVVDDAAAAAVSAAGSAAVSAAGSAAGSGSASGAKPHRGKAKPRRPASISLHDGSSRQGIGMAWVVCKQAAALEGIVALMEALMAAADDRKTVVLKVLNLVAMQQKIRDLSAAKDSAAVQPRLGTMRKRFPSVGRDVQDAVMEWQRAHGTSLVFHGKPVLAVLTACLTEGALGNLSLAKAFQLDQRDSRRRSPTFISDDTNPPAGLPASLAGDAVTAAAVAAAASTTAAAATAAAAGVAVVSRSLRRPSPTTKVVLESSLSMSSMPTSSAPSPPSTSRSASGVFFPSSASLNLAGLAGVPLPRVMEASSAEVKMPAGSSADVPLPLGTPLGTPPSGAPGAGPSSASRRFNMGVHSVARLRDRDRAAGPSKDRAPRSSGR